MTCEYVFLFFSFDSHFKPSVVPFINFSKGLFGKARIIPKVGQAMGRAKLQGNKAILFLLIIAPRPE